jgi:2-polyprenyl-6-methoxyphenol hydroxylase-like FAD-dependent oxidoreductase
MHAIVVGAGIGGLATAIGLRRAGWEVSVLEKAHEVRAAGAALSLAPNATLALDDLGLLDEVLANGVRVTGGEALDADGTVLKRVLLDQGEGKVRHPMVFTLRPKLHAVLQRALGLAIETEARVVACDASKGSVTLADGTQRQADVVIGADGLRSVVRTSVLGAQDPRPLGITAIRGLADDDGSVPTGFARLLFGRAQEAGVASCGGGLLYWYLSSPTGRFPDLASTVAALPRDVRERCMGTPQDRVRVDTLHDRAPAPRWHSGRVVLLGDAVHAMAPHSGQGAAQALLDAAALSQALAPVAKVEGLQAAFRSYERARKRTAERAVARARRNSRVSLMASPLLCRPRAFVIRHMPDALLLRQFGGVDVATTEG